MNQKRIKELKQDYKNALDRLEEALQENALKGSIVVDGTIQRFEFTFELAWKLAKALLVHGGIEVNSPRSAIKEGFQAKLFDNGEGWIDMLEDRNKTSHLYDEDESFAIYEKIKKNHVHLLNGFWTKNSGTKI
ncbi:MAG TPA: nucleotidyltransferase [Deltaproteobacteria bacterium]|nr:MAG: hypothetical protein A2048_07545 [Deltaproteobacteria bacterium GWA2_45_12]HBF12024.1 nucleotidyltransferase [Deltaproteobacteria bacterium]